MNSRLPGISADTHVEIRGLIATLLATERRLTDLTGGEVDAVTDAEGRPFLFPRAQEQLRHREAEKQAAILDGLPARIALLDSAGTIASVNAPWRHFIGGKSKLGAEFGLGLNYAEICDAVQSDRAPEARQMAAGVRSVLKGESPSFSIEYSDGAATHQRWFQTLVTPLSGAGANGAIVMHQDITERRQIERDLKEARVATVVRESSSRYDFLADAVPLIIWTTRADGRADYHNKAWFEFTGITPGEPEEGVWEAVVHPDDRPRCLARWAHSCTTGENYEIEYRFKRADGTYRWFLSRATARRDENNQIVQWVGTGTDIDDQKRTVTELLSGQVELERRVAIRTAELSIINRALKMENAERTKTEIALRESNEKFHQLAENITDAFWIRSADMSEVHYVSPAFTQIWGRPVETLYANPQRWTEFIFPEDQARVQAAFAALTATAPSLDIEYRIVRPDGEIRWVRVRGFQIRSAEDVPIRHVGVVTDITEQKASAMALSTSLAEFRLLAESMPQIVWITRADGWNIYFSQQWVYYTGMSLEESMGHGWITPFHPDDKTRAMAAWQQATATGGTYSTECRLRKATGEYRWWLIRGVPVQDRAGKIAKWFGTCTDIQELKLAELAISRTNRALEEQQTELRALIDMVPAIIVFKDTNNVYRRVNRRLAESLGKSVAELEGKTSEEIFPREAQHYDREDLKVTASGTPEMGLVTNSRDPEGKEVWHQIDKVPVRDHAGRVVGLVIMAQDITERKRAELALQTSEVRFKALFEQAAVGVALIDAVTGRFVQINQRFCEFLGRTGAEMTALTFLEVTHPADLERCIAQTQKITSGLIRAFTQEKRYLQKDGTPIWASVTVSPLWALGEAPDYFIAVAQDVGERKRLEDQIRQAHKMEAVGTLAGGIAHDFNNILAAICGYTELSQLTLEGNSEVRSHLEAIRKAGLRATDLVRQILTFSRQQTLERRPIQLLPVLAEALTLLRATIPSTIEFETSLPSNAPTVLADATQVHQMLVNLGTNAWHAMKDQPGRLKVTLERCEVDATHAATQSRLRPGLYARVSVSDTGSGMTEAIQRRIFEPFFTTKPAGEGTGLGLAVVHGIMETHEGAITIYSQPGEGTVFHLYFPAHAGEAASLSADPDAVPRGRGERILFVDDEELLVQLGQKALTALGYVVEVATQPLVALALLRAEPQRFAVVITDQTMPRMTGLVLAGELQQIRPGLPIILTSGYSQAITPEGVAAAGIRELLLKPFTIQSLGHAVHSALHPTPPLNTYGSNSPY